MRTPPHFIERQKGGRIVFGPGLFFYALAAWFATHHDGRVAKTFQDFAPYLHLVAARRRIRKGSLFPRRKEKKKTGTSLA